MERHFLAVDSGGTKTLWRLIRAQGQTVISVKTDGMASSFPGIAPVKEITEQAFSALSPYPTPEAVFFSLGGPNTEEIETALCSLWRNVTVSREANGDTMLPAAAHFGCTGAVLCGTGSTAVGICGGKRVYAGGWGPLYGDEGSGGGLGKDALVTYLRSLNGTGTFSELKAVFHFLSDGIDPKEFTGRMELKRRAMALSRRELAAVVPALYTLWKSGSREAEALFAKAAEEIACLARAVGEDGRVLLCGGFLRDKPELLEKIAALCPGGIVYEPRFAPITAAGCAALEKGGVIVSTDIFENLLNG